MPKRTPAFNTGDKVAYSVQWLRSVGLSHSEYSHARGVVTDTKPCGGMTLVSIDWSIGELPPRVNAANLAHVGTNTRFANC